ncbi:hypothetical protein DFH09DRAFT_1418514 [Mycena vulgaris]|nr:hypothetical protein DFH09DRAFT_1418514 [Mycena vulgaris]
MSTMSTPNAASSSPPHTPAKGNWLAGLLTTAKVIAAGAECLPLPYVKGAFGMVVVILGTVETETELPTNTLANLHCFQNDYNHPKDSLDIREWEALRPCCDHFCCECPPAVAHSSTTQRHSMLCLTKFIVALDSYRSRWGRGLSSTPAHFCTTLTLRPQYPGPPPLDPTIHVWPILGRGDIAATEVPLSRKECPFDQMLHARFVPLFDPASVSWPVLLHLCVIETIRGGVTPNQAPTYLGTQVKLNPHSHFLSLYDLRMSHKEVSNARHYREHSRDKTGGRSSLRHLPLGISGHGWLVDLSCADKWRHIEWAVNRVELGGSTRWSSPFGHDLGRARLGWRDLFIKRIQTLPSHDYAFLLTFSNFSASSGTARLARPPARDALTARPALHILLARAGRNRCRRPARPPRELILDARPRLPPQCQHHLAVPPLGTIHLRDQQFPHGKPGCTGRASREQGPRRCAAASGDASPDSQYICARPPPTAQHLARTGTWYLPARDRLTPAPRSPSSHHPRPAHKRPTRTRTAHRIRLPMRLRSRPPVPACPHVANRSAASREYGDLAPPRAPTCTLSARLAHDISRHIHASTGTRCHPPRAPCTTQSRCSLYLHPVRTRLAHDIPRRMSTDASPCGLSAPPAPRSFLLVPGPRRERKESLLRRPYLERRARTPHRGRLALALAPPAVAASSTARARGRAGLVPESPPANWDDPRCMSVRVGARAETGTERDDARADVRQRREGSIRTCMGARRSDLRMAAGRTRRVKPEKSWTVCPRRVRGAIQGLAGMVWHKRTGGKEALELVVLSTTFGMAAGEHNALASGVQVGVAAGVSAVVLSKSRASSSQVATTTSGSVNRKLI